MDRKIIDYIESFDEINCISHLIAKIIRKSITLITFLSSDFYGITSSIKSR